METFPPTLQPGKILAGIFLFGGLCFLIPSLVVLPSLLSDIKTAQKARAWPTREARILKVDLFQSYARRSRTREAQARYEYLWQGKRYESSRVGIESGSDNIGNRQEERYQIIKGHFDRNTPMPCYVDPSDPSKAILFPELRPEIAIVRGAVAVLPPLIFLLVGGAFYGAALQAKKIRDRLAASPGQPWMARAEWNTASILCGEKNTRWFLTGGAVFWNAFFYFWFLGIGIKEILSSGFFMILSFFLASVGFLLVWQTILQHLRYFRFGKVWFDLEPFPGRIGGEVGGTIRTKARLDSSSPSEIRLECLRQRTSGGRSRTTREEMLWSAQVSNPLIQACGNEGALIPVKFQVPEGLPPSTVEGVCQAPIFWRLSVRVSMRGPDFVATFDIPVFGL